MNRKLKDTGTTSKAAKKAVKPSQDAIGSPSWQKVTAEAAKKYRTREERYERWLKTPVQG